MTWTKTVYSSMVAEVGYDAEQKELYITWTRGKRSIYSGVPEELAQQVANAPSVGSILNSDIKPYYSHRYECHAILFGHRVHRGRQDH